MRHTAAGFTVALLSAAAVGLTAAADPAQGDAPTFAGLSRLGKNEQRQWEYRHEATGIVFVLIPAGEFWMGSPDDEPYRDPDERRHRVRITKPYLMGKYEITNGQFRKHFQPAHDSGAFAGQALNGDGQPVVDVSWQDAADFCAKWGFRLPTEAEWESAARGGEEKNVFPWGKDWPPPAKAGNFDDLAGRALLNQQKHYDARRTKDPESVLPATWDDGFAVTAPVGDFAPYGFGLHDMAGNVWEWCGDWKGEYPPASAEVAVDPVGPSTGAHRALRGGSWNNYDRKLLRCAYRFTLAADHRLMNYGFRVVLTAEAK